MNDKDSQYKIPESELEHANLDVLKKYHVGLKRQIFLGCSVLVIVVLAFFLGAKFGINFTKDYKDKQEALSHDLSEFIYKQKYLDDSLAIYYLMLETLDRDRDREVLRAFEDRIYLIFQDLLFSLDEMKKYSPDESLVAEIKEKIDRKESEFWERSLKRK